MRTRLFAGVGATLAFLVAVVLVLVVVPLIQNTPSASAAIPSLGWNTLGDLVVGTVLLLAARHVVWPPVVLVAAGMITALWGVLLLVAVPAFGVQDPGMQWATVLTYLSALGDFGVAICAALMEVVTLRSVPAI